MPAIETRAVLPPGSWRHAGPYAALAATGARGLAWELLRRYPAYPGDGDEGDSPLTVADAAFTARWGLHFRRGTGPLCVRRTAPMVGRLRSVGIARPARAGRGPRRRLAFGRNLPRCRRG
ncbi:transcriptional regulator domain-containing protein [Sphingopyxis granuli]|uniref:transcriptional regulator domain-containing protein n=1 Tax=Sphingopyxis granuli TaxID=267128 RepID=UPI00301DCBA5